MGGESGSESVDMLEMFEGIEPADMEAVEDSSSCEIEVEFPMFTP